MLAAKSFIQNSYGASCYCGHSCSSHASVVIAGVVSIIIIDVVIAIVMVIVIAIMKNKVFMIITVSAVIAAASIVVAAWCLLAVGCWLLASRRPVRLRIVLPPLGVLLCLLSRRLPSLLLFFRRRLVFLLCSEGRCVCALSLQTCRVFLLFV